LIVSEGVSIIVADVHCSKLDLELLVSAFAVYWLSLSWFRIPETVWLSFNDVTLLRQHRAP